MASPMLFVLRHATCWSQFDNDCVSISSCVCSSFRLGHIFGSTASAFEESGARHPLLAARGIWMPGM